MERKKGMKKKRKIQKWERESIFKTPQVESLQFTLRRDQPRQERLRESEKRGG
jgi:hypothetical protein